MSWLPGLYSAPELLPSSSSLSNSLSRVSSAPIPWSAEIASETSASGFVASSFKASFKILFALCSSADSPVLYSDPELFPASSSLAYKVSSASYACSPFMAAMAFVTSAFGFSASSSSASFRSLLASSESALFPSLAAASAISLSTAAIFSSYFFAADRLLLSSS